jgi:integrase
MTGSTLPISLLRQRMIDDMRMCKLADKTQTHYLRAVRQFVAYLGSSPDTASFEDLRNDQLQLVDQGISPVSLNAAISGLKFFFDITLGRAELMARMQPVVLRPEEVSRLIAAAGNLKHQTALSVAYGAGLQASEVVTLKAGDVDSQRMTLRIEQGKGRKDRYAMLSPMLLEWLRVWWKVARAQPPQQEKRIEHAVSYLAVIKGEPLKFSVTGAVNIAAVLLSDQRPDAEQLLVHAPWLAAEFRFKDVVWHGDELVMREGHWLVLEVRLT